MNTKSKYSNPEYIGKTYGELTIIKFLASDDDYNDTLESAFLCQCSCGNTVVKKASRLTHNKVRSCGDCSVSKYNNKEYIGKMYGALKILKFLNINDSLNTENAPAFLCECVCKNITVKKANHVINGSVQSCGECHTTRSKYADTNFIGKKFGKLTVIGIGHNGVQNTFICNCECNRSENIEYSASMIYNGYKKQCNICSKEMSDDALITKRYSSTLLANLLGQKFGKLTIKSIYKDIDGCTVARCDCDCGTKDKDVFLSNLYRDVNGTRACGKCRIAPNAKYDNEEYIGKTINNLTILDIKKEDGKVYWKCRCEWCDKHNINWFKAYGVASGNNKSCGCMQSYAENVIENALKSKSIRYRKQVTFENLRGIRGGILRFDFGIYDNNNNLLGLIEYDGSQHFTDCNENYYITEFELANAVNIVKENDKIKNEYCIDNKIQLVRLSGKITEEIFFEKMTIACTEYKNTYIVTL